MEINGYILDNELKNANSGFSKWGFAKKDGSKYFIKEFINPVYPIDRGIMTDEMFNSKVNECMKFERRMSRMFDSINKSSCGNLVRADEFFRFGSRYYLVTKKLSENSVTAEYISRLGKNDKLFFLRTLAFCFYCLHSASLVHFDVKPDNVIAVCMPSGKFTAKLIDFDSGFFVGEEPNADDLGGDLAYYSPEAFLKVYGEDVTIDEKSDIFSLGLLIHKYYSGELPGYADMYDYPYEAVLDGAVLVPKFAAIPPELCNLIVSMLNREPSKRPDAYSVTGALSGMMMHAESPPSEPPRDSWFRPAGDL